MESRIPQSHTFVVKLWLEHREVEGLEAEWRGELRDVRTGGVRYFRDLGRLAELISMVFLQVIIGWTLMGITFLLVTTVTTILKYCMTQRAMVSMEMRKVHSNRQIRYHYKPEVHHRVHPDFSDPIHKITPSLP